MVAQLRRGRDLAGRPKAEATELAPEAVGASPPVAVTIPVVLRAAWRAFLYGTNFCFW